MTVKGTFAPARANVTSWRAWAIGAFQAILYGLAAAILSALGVNGAAGFDMPIEPLNFGQLGGIVISTAVGKLAQYISITPVPGGQPPDQ